MVLWGLRRRKEEGRDWVDSSGLFSVGGLNQIHQALLSVIASQVAKLWSKMG